jgi:regulatory protein
MTDFDSQFFEQDACFESFDGFNPADIRLAAMNLLARREHSKRELRQKLMRRFPQDQLVQIELERLAQENLQSDARFAEAFLRERADRGYGFMKVRQELRDRGLSDVEIKRAVDEADVDWSALAREVYNKKFGAEAASDLHERAKRSRFMQYRGFDRDDYQLLLKDKYSNGDG